MGRLQRGQNTCSERECSETPVRGQRRGAAARAKEKVAEQQWVGQRELPEKRCQEQREIAVRKQIDAKKATRKNATLHKSRLSKPFRQM